MGSETNVGNSQQQKSTLHLDFVGANNQRRYQLEGHFKPMLKAKGPIFLQEFLLGQAGLIFFRTGTLLAHHYS